MIGRGPALVRTGTAVLLLLSTACGLFTVKDPYERWDVTIAYRDEEGRVTADPDRIEVNGPRGEIDIVNRTDVERGFAIEELAIFSKISDDDAVTIQVSGVQDGETYAFRDDLHRGGPRGEIVVRYVRRD